MRAKITKIIGAMHRGITEFKMINSGDKIAVGVSGGKDSLMLLTALAQYQKQSKIKFEIIAIAVDLFNGTDFSKIEDYSKTLNIEFYVIKTNIQQVVFEIKKEENPCSLCSKMRKGALYEQAKKLGCNKVALGHHADDFLQTFFISFSKENRLSTLAPIMYLSKTNLHVIRPFIYVWENAIIEKSSHLPIIENTCPANKKTERENMKNIINNLNFQIPNFKKNLFEALTKTERYNLLDKYKKNNENQ